MFLRLFFFSFLVSSQSSFTMQLIISKATRHPKNIKNIPLLHLAKRNFLNSCAECKCTKNIIPSPLSTSTSGILTNGHLDIIKKSGDVLDYSKKLIDQKSEYQKKGLWPSREGDALENELKTGNYCPDLPSCSNQFVAANIIRKCGGVGTLLGSMPFFFPYDFVNCNTMPLLTISFLAYCMAARYGIHEGSLLFSKAEDDLERLEPKGR